MLARLVAKARGLPVLLLVIAAQDERLARVFVAGPGRRHRLPGRLKIVRADHRVRTPLGEEDEEERRGQKCPHASLSPYDPQKTHRFYSISHTPRRKKGFHMGQNNVQR